jgi:diguanylate cyclase (GGDEF)-like protein
MVSTADLDQPARRLLGVRLGAPWLIFGLTIVTGAAYLASPTGAGAQAFSGFAVLCAVMVAGSVWRNRPPVRWPWVCLSAAAILFLIGIAIRSFTARPGPAGIQMTSSADLWTWAGYICLGVFMYGLIPAEGRHDPAVTLDAASVMVTGALVLWAVLVNPAFIVPGATAWDRMTVTASPIADVVIFFLLMRAYWGRDSRPASLTYVTIGLGAMIVGDTGYGLHGARLLGGIGDSYLSVWFLIGYAGLALAAWDPSMVELTSVGPARRTVSEGPVRQATVLGSMIIPILLLLLWPHSTAIELWVGGILALAQTCVTFARLMISLSRISAQQTDAWWLARTNALTGLPNRARVMELLAADCAQGRHPAVVLVSLTAFSEVNEAWGPQVGDALLTAVAQRLLTRDLGGATVAHVADDVFAAILPDGDDAARVTARILTVFDGDFPITGVGQLPLLASAACSAQGDDAVSLWRSACLAARQAKLSEASEVVEYRPEMAAAAARRVAIAQALRGATGRGEFTAFYQPLFAVGSHALVGYETLMRWTSPTLVWVSPAEFIPIAEQTGVIVEMGTWILREACHQMAQWHREPGRSGLHVSVNLAPRQLASPEVDRLVEQILRDSGLSPDALWLEVTETDLMKDPEEAARRLDKLRRLGVTLAVDDFGTGHASLSYLSTFPVDVLKVDRAFVKGLGTPCRETAIAEAVTAMAHVMDMMVVAEGVETPLQLRELERIGVDVLQGFLLGKPAPAGEAAYDCLLAPTGQAGRGRLPVRG